MRVDNDAEFDVVVPKVLWVLYFCYATCIALVFQKLLLPMLPSLHAGHGLLTNDSIYFHSVAMDLASQIRISGWSNWSLWPAKGCSANVAILSILYVYFGPDPSLAIPINAVLHASGGVLIYLIAKVIFPGKVGHYAGLISSALFIVFPSSLNWYAQIHKDGYAILGLLLVLYSWLRWINLRGSKNKLLIFLVGNISGGILLLSVRPYAVDILFLAVFVLFLITLIGSICGKKWNLFTIIGGAAAVFSVGLVVMVVHIYDLGDDSEAIANGHLSAGVFERVCENYPTAESWQWQSSQIVPEKIDYYAKAATIVRLVSICTGYDSSAIYDRHKVPESATSLLIYLPRVLQVALFAPFPDVWFKDASITKIIGWVEIFIWYLSIPGVIYLLWRRRASLSVWLVFSFSLVFILVYGYVTANLGTLHRVRYPFIMLLMLLGTIGWCSLIFKRFRLSVFDKKIKLSRVDSNEVLEPERGKLISAGISVVCFTALSFLLFFYRDVLMGKQYGVGNELDAFFLAMLLPMFVVSVFSIPLGSALIPVYLKLQERSGRNAEIMLARVLFFSLAGLLILGSLLLVFGKYIYPIFVSGLDIDAIIRTLNLLPFAVLIMVLSVVVVIGNAVLNARSIYTLPALFQITVPVCAIVALFIFGQDHGIVSVVAGMLVGQIINLGLVIYLLYQDGFILKPSFKNRASNEGYGELWKLYMALAIAALFMSAATVIDNVMASGLGAGSIGVYSLGSKVAIFITGIIGAALTSVVLPRFSALFSQGNVDECRRDLTFFIFIGTALTIPAGLVLFAFCDDVVRIIFRGDMMSMQGASEVGRVAIFGAIQLPFFVSHALFIKFLNAYQKGKFVVVAAALGLILNIVLNIVLMRAIGVAGLALATTLAMLVTSFVLLVVISKFGHLRALDVLLIVISWGLYLTTILCMYFQSYAGVVVSVIAMLLLILEILMTQQKPLLN